MGLLTNTVLRSDLMQWSRLLGTFFGTVTQNFQEVWQFYAIASLQQLMRLKASISPLVTKIISSPVYSGIVLVFRLFFIPFVAYGMENRTDQIFLLVYSFISLKRGNLAMEQKEGIMVLWRLLLPSLLLARDALPRIPRARESQFSNESGGKDIWRIFSITQHLIVIFSEIRDVTSDSADPALESFAVGAICMYIMSLSVWTGISVLSLLSFSFLFHVYCYPFSELEPHFMYAVVFYLERDFLSFDSHADEKLHKSGKEKRKVQ